METEVTNHSGAPGRWIFVEAYYNLPGIWESEWLEYYPATNLERLRSELKSHIEHQLDLFSESEYEDHFSAAEYGNLEDDVSADELLLFRATLPKSEQRLPLNELQRDYSHIVWPNIAEDVHHTRLLVFGRRLVMRDARIFASTQRQDLIPAALKSGAAYYRIDQRGEGVHAVPYTLEVAETTIEMGMDAR